MANKVCKYWEKRVEFFGKEKAFLSMSLRGAMRDDKETFATVDLIRYLPQVEDRSGRAIIYRNPGRYNPGKDDRKSVVS